jgi:hypothetical protein
MLTIGMAVERPSCLGAKRGRGEVRRTFAALCFVLVTCGTPFGPPANAEEPEQIAAKTEIDDGTAQETVLVSFGYSAPEGVEAEIAKEHNLKLVSKLGLPTLGMRIVRYAIPDSRPLATVLARLRADQRVSSAQVNVQYRELEPAAPDTVVGSLQKPPLAGPRRTAARKTVERREASIFGDRRPARPARVAVGDVLAGGL